MSEAYRLLDNAVEAGRNAAWRRGSQPSQDLSAALQRFGGAAHPASGTKPPTDPTQILQTLAQLAQPIAGIAQALSQMHVRNTGVDLGSVWPVPRWDRADTETPARPVPSEGSTAPAWEPIEPEDDDEMSAGYPGYPSNTSGRVDRPLEDPSVLRDSTPKLRSDGGELPFDVPGSAAVLEEQPPE